MRALVSSIFALENYQQHGSQVVSHDCWFMAAHSPNNFRPLQASSWRHKSLQRFAKLTCRLLRQALHCCDVNGNILYPLGILKEQDPCLPSADSRVCQWCSSISSRSCQCMLVLLFATDLASIMIYLAIYFHLFGMISVDRPFDLSSGGHPQRWPRGGRFGCTIIPTSTIKSCDCPDGDGTLGAFKGV